MTGLFGLLLKKKIEPYLDLKIEYYDLGIESRDKTSYKKPLIVLTQ